MIVPQPLRTIGIVVCGVALGAPAVVCHDAHSPSLGRIVDVVRTLFPLWIYLIVQLSMDEGRVRERRARGVPDPD
ncbi:hypothetical protein BE04_44565 [Sorangium cellulosum]|uniref:Uncharacterized protein n=2 Tax=Sorangium cellulosum TaxID=56 RepID=A0A150PFR7_SORCE|nr:hypothetical protein SCE1572_29120 [Sorangium cellulosum So0157-2]KYF54551.1 hypothetical protein BE04_44565 [Sorangium cellulosum]KYF89760.1 hypothetical protein BE20_19700 [Sorangium cellulosum]KYF99149.1 hypothetical protein BE18_25205 [Sorangium cellulosum]